MVDVDAVCKKIREMNDGKHTQTDIAKALGIGRTTVNKYVQKMVKDEGFVYNQPRKAKYNEKYRIEAETMRAQICDMVIKGHSPATIAEDLGISKGAVTLVVKELIEDGTIEEVKVSRKIHKTVAIVEKKKKKQYAAPTLELGETIACNTKVAKTCVYGANNDTNGICNYLMITGKSRLMICPMSACTCYSKRSKKNKILN